MNFYEQFFLYVRVVDIRNRERAQLEKIIFCPKTIPIRVLTHVGFVYAVFFQLSIFCWSDGTGRPVPKPYSRCRLF